MKKTIISIGAVILVALAAWFFIVKKPATKTIEQNANIGASSLGGALSGGVSDVQPIEKIPNVNPFNSVETNPYKQGYTNPFSK